MFGDLVIYTPTTGSAKTIRGVYSDPIELEDIVPSVNGYLFFAAADLAAAGITPARGDTVLVTVRGVSQAFMVFDLSESFSPDVTLKLRKK